MVYLSHAFDYFLLAFGFGFVIFFHELGHFLAAKYCDVKVEQFAVGFGPAIFSWRKGLGFRRGSSAKEVQDIERAAEEGIKNPDRVVSDTEYRLNWIPLGGYVKMLGQDDLRVDLNDDPRSYNKKTIGQRMIIVSAGVVMNVILAAIGFMIVFRLGYPMPPAIVGGTATHSPALMAHRADGTRVGLVPGDKILAYDGKDTTGDFTKIALDVALTRAGRTIPIQVEHVDGAKETLYVEPQHTPDDPSGLMQLGIAMPSQLAGFKRDEIASDWDEAKLRQSQPKDFFDVLPDHVITQVNGSNVNVSDFWKLDLALAQSNGQPVDITVEDPSTGKSTHATVQPHFNESFGKDDLDFLGLVPRTQVEAILDKSAALGRLKPGDVITDIQGSGDSRPDPSRTLVKSTLSQAGEDSKAISLTLLDPDNAERVVSNITPNLNIGNGKVGLGVNLRADEMHLVVAEVLPGSTADGKIPPRATITAVNGQPVSNWFQFRTFVADSKVGDSLNITFMPHGESSPRTADLKLSQNDITDSQTVGFTSDLALREMPGVLKTSNPFIAMKLGVIETRDLIEQFYLTLNRMFTGSLSYKNAMGPVGMFAAGSQIAVKGTNWLLWYLSMISANLAVVNFLPFPIVDGGLFTLLILEKIQGKPLSPDVQKVVQAVGLALILGFFLLVTWQDIARYVGY